MFYAYSQGIIQKAKSPYRSTGLHITKMVLNAHNLLPNIAPELSHHGTHVLLPIPKG